MTHENLTGMELEQSLGPNNEFNGLRGEVVDYDIYHLRNVADVVSINDPNYIHEKGHRGIDFVPDTVIDLGGNVGIFSRYAQSLWPNAKIVAVEPNPNNCAVFREHTTGVTLIEAAIGKGDVYHSLGSANGAMEVYLTKSTGFNELAFSELSKVNVLEKSSVRTIMLTDLKEYISGKTLIKIDIEGNETVIFNDPESMELLKTFDYIVMELHYFASDGERLDAVKAKTEEALGLLKKTHDTRFEHIYFYARKRGAGQGA